MDDVDVVLIGFEEVENLGLRYIAAYLNQKGIPCGILAYQASGQEAMLQELGRVHPKVVGFSLIFQRMLYDFAQMIGYFRKHGVTAHFTMGGHFPSIEPQKVMAEIPGLDSIVRGEGEVTMLELVRHMDEPDQWPHIKGLALRKNRRIVTTEPRPLVEDLDSLPFPVRNKEAQIHRGVGVGSILGSRGCYYNCSFCSIRRFYEDSPGFIRRTRSPGNLLAEMTQLYEQQGVRVFIFEDDDFLTRNRVQRKWMWEFIKALKVSGMGDNILWRVSSRVDDLEEELVSAMKEVGLMSIYIGVESGNEEGLKIYNKHYSVADIHRALEMLNRLHMPFEFGFMILNPGSTLDTIKEDILFLKKINLHKQAVFQFTKMVPYAGTPIARELGAQGRLKGGVESPDYSYGDPRVDLVQLFFTLAFHQRNFENNGLVELLRHAKFDALLTGKFQSQRYDTAAYMSAVRELIYDCNALSLEKMSLAVHFMERFDVPGILERWDYLQRLILEEKGAEQRMTHSLLRVMNQYGHPF